MLDINFLRDNIHKFSDSQKKRGLASKNLEGILSLDELRKKQLQKLELLRATSNDLSKDSQSAKKNKAKLTELKKQISELKNSLEKSESKLQEQLIVLPNIVSEDVPAGDATHNQVVSQSGKPTTQGLSHEEILTKQGWVDLTTAAQFSGSRFRYLIGEAAVAARKLNQLAIDLAIKKGFTLVLPPIIARQELMEAAGFFPAGQEDTFSVGDDRFLVGTSEPMLLALAANKKYQPAELPVRFVGFSTCFRKEAGSYGKDVKGIFRVHQFDKVEMVSIVEPAQSEKEHQFLVSIQKELVEKFHLPYQEVLLAAGDQSQIAAKQVDIECWFPSQQRYRETHSASNCTDYQSKLLKTRVAGEETSLAHTLNATLATERLLLAILENNSTPDGQVTWPKELTS